MAYYGATNGQMGPIILVVWDLKLFNIPLKSEKNLPVKSENKKM